MTWSRCARGHPQGVAADTAKSRKYPTVLIQHYTTVQRYSPHWSGRTRATHPPVARRIQAFPVPPAHFRLRVRRSEPAQVGCPSGLPKRVAQARRGLPKISLANRSYQTTNRQKMESDTWVFVRALSSPCEQSDV